MNVARFRHALPVLSIGLATALAIVTPRIAHAHEGHGGSCDGSCEHHRKHDGDHHGPRLGIHHLLEGVELRAEQREALMKLHRAAMDDREVVQGATKAYRIELAKQVRAGAVDESSLEKLRAKTAADLAALPPVHVGMLAKLHAILDRTQRAQVADKLAKTPPGGPGREPPPEAPEGKKRPRHHGAHGHDRGREGGPGLHRLHAFADELDLTPSQRDAIAKALHERMTSERTRAEHQAMRAEMEKRHQALAERFRADTFAVTDADKLPAELAGGRIAHLSSLAVVATPTLTVNQRIKLAEKIEQGRQDDEP
jgi:Spy/CpxP family protein refolding chaperone